MTLSDEQLIEQIKIGNEQAENEIFSRFKDLVVKIARGYFIVGGDIEDLVQEGMIGLYKAIKSFSPQKDTTFKTFAVLCIKRQIQTAIKRALSGKNKPLSQAVSFQSFSSSQPENLEFLPEELVFENTPADRAIDKENFEHLKKIIKENLSPLEFKVLKLYLQGFSYREISNTLGIKEKSIDNSLSRIKAKLREKLKN